MERLTRRKRQLLTAMFEDPDWSPTVLELGERCVIRSGTMYPAMRTLREAGLVESRWDLPDDGQPVRRYRLTSAGKKLAQEIVAGTIVNTSWRNLVVR